MPPLLKIGGRDLSPYLHVHEEGGIDPVDADRIEPQFSGNAALREGARAAGDITGNREWVLPLLLSAASRSALHELVRQINNDLVAGAQVEFAIDSTIDPSTFFELESGRLDVQFQYFLALHSSQRATLALWTRPHGSTGTQQLIASFSATGPQSFPATAIYGDIDALADLEVRVGSHVATTGRVVGYGVHPHPSFNPIHSADSALLTGQSGAAVVGQAGGVASRYLRVPISPTGASGIAVTDVLGPADAHVGRHRVFAVARHQLSGDVAVYARDRFGAILGPTALITQSDSAKFQLLDLGEINVQGRASGQEGVPTQRVELFAGGASGYTANSTGLHLSALIYLPLDYSPGLMRTPGAGGQSSLYSDLFDAGNAFNGAYLSQFPNAVGGAWSVIAGQLGWTNFGPDSSIGMPDSPAVGYRVATGATGWYAMASGAQNSDVQAALTIWSRGALPSTLLASGFVDLYAKTQPASGFATVGVWAHFTMGPSQSLSLLSRDAAGATTLHASAGIPSVLASGIFQGQRHVMTLRTIGGRADVWFATSGLAASPVISASHADLAMSGAPAIRAQTGGRASSSNGDAAPYFENFSVLSAGGSAPDGDPREWFRFESHPEERAIQSNASVFRFDRLSDFKGNTPRIMPVPTTATGPARVLVFEGEVDDFLGNDLIDVRLESLSRFQFLR